MKSLRNQQDTCEVSRKSHRTSRIAVKSVEKILEDQQGSYEVSRKSLGTSRIAIQSLERVW